MRANVLAQKITIKNPKHNSLGNGEPHLEYVLSSDFLSEFLSAVQIIFFIVSSIPSRER